MPDEHAFFAAHGWVVIRNVVPRGRLEELERAVNEVFAASPPPRPGEVWELSAVSRGSPEIARHTHDAAIARLAAAALGCARIQLLQDTVLVKPALVGGEVAWHQDHTYTGYLAPPRMASVRLALTECTIENGCLEVIDGSHEWGQVGDVRALSEPSVADALGDRAAAWIDRVVPLELEPGDLSIHHCFTFHRSGANRSARTRKTLITRLFDADCRLVEKLLPPGVAAHFPVDAEGRLSQVAFPILWPGSDVTVAP